MRVMIWIASSCGSLSFSFFFESDMRDKALRLFFYCGVMSLESEGLAGESGCFDFSSYAISLLSTFDTSMTLGRLDL